MLIIYNKCKKIINKVIHLKRHFKRTFKNLKVFDYKHFINQILDEDFVVQILDNISNGTVLILKNSIDAKYLDKHIDILNKIAKFKRTDFTKNC